MKYLNAYSIIFFCQLFFCSSIVKAQHTLNDYNVYYTGCWETGNAADGYLITRADHTFQWIKADTLHGSWQIKGAISLPKKTTVMILKFSGGKKKRYEIGVTSVPAVIYLRQHVEFRKVACK